MVAGHSMWLQTAQCCCLGAGKVFFAFFQSFSIGGLKSFVRSSVALHAEVDALEDLGNYLRTVSLEVDPTFTLTVFCKAL